jgi:hypothetical protein
LTYVFLFNIEINAAGSTFGTNFRVTTFGESHGGGVGCIIDGCPPRIPLSEADMQFDLDRRLFLLFFSKNYFCDLFCASRCIVLINILCVQEARSEPNYDSEKRDGYLQNIFRCF